MRQTHKIGGLVATAPVAAHFAMSVDNKGPVFILYFILLCIGANLGSALPDIDHPNSSINKGKFSLLTLPYRLLSRLFIYIGENVKRAKHLSDVFSHRGLTHGVIESLVLCVAIIYLADITFGKNVAIIAIGFAMGILSHLLLDFISGGIPVSGLLFPKKRIGIRLVMTGSTKEEIVKFVLYITFAGTILYSLYVLHII